jgi:hypothetical protein
MLRDMPDQRFRALERLIQQANQASSRKPDSVEMLAHVIRLITRDGADPYLVIGVLMEGAVYTIAEHIPPERQADTVEQLRELLEERLKARGLE